ncbi:MAG: UGSC family (seleno)protein [Actinomycetes bacterium]
MPDEFVLPTGWTGVTGPEKLYRTGLAQRRPDLAAARVGLLGNSKRNAELLLAAIGTLLVAEHGVASVSLVQSKAAFAWPVSDEVAERYRRTCDLVVTGVGDCESCSASAVADGILFEQAGLPAAVICTEEFVVTADAMAELRGAPDYDYVVTEHPVSALTPEEVRERGRRLVPEVVSLLTTGDRCDRLLER